MHAVVLERSNHFEAGAVAHVRQAGVPVPAEVALVDEPVLRPVEYGPPFFELAHAVRGALGVQLGHTPLVQELTAAHRIPEMDFPVVARIDVAQGGRHAAFGHHGMRLAQERFGHHTGVHPQRRALDGGTQAGAPGADHQHVVLEGLQFSYIYHSVIPMYSNP